jgi:hypothetical protein
VESTPTTPGSRTVRRRSTFGRIYPMVTTGVGPLCSTSQCPWGAVSARRFVAVVGQAHEVVRVPASVFGGRVVGVPNDRGPAERQALGEAGVSGVRDQRDLVEPGLDPSRPTGRRGDRTQAGHGGALVARSDDVGVPGVECRPGSAGLFVVSAAVALAVRTCSRWLLIGETFDEGLPVAGRVLATYVLPGDQGRAGLQHAIVGFRAADGRAYRLDTEADCRRPMGARVRLRYLPANPVRAVLVEAGRGTLRTVLTLLFLAGLGLGGLSLTLLCLLCGEWNPATGKRADRREPTFSRIEFPCSVVPVPMAGKSEPCPGVDGQLRFPGSWFTQRVMRRSVCPRYRSGYFSRSEKWIEAGRVLRPTVDPAF